MQLRQKAANTAGWYIRAFFSGDANFLCHAREKLMQTPSPTVCSPQSLINNSVFTVFLVLLQIFMCSYLTRPPHVMYSCRPCLLSDNHRRHTTASAHWPMCNGWIVYLIEPLFFILHRFGIGTSSDHILFSSKYISCAFPHLVPFFWPKLTFENSAMLNRILLQILSIIIIEMTSENIFTSFSWSCWFRLFSIRQQVKSVFSLNFNKLFLKQLFHISAKIGVEIFTFSQRSKVLRSKKKSQRGATKAPTLESKL